jgi:hypothetical protein
LRGEPADGAVAQADCVGHGGRVGRGRPAIARAVTVSIAVRVGGSAGVSLPR